MPNAGAKMKTIVMGFFIEFANITERELLCCNNYLMGLLYVYANVYLALGSSELISSNSLTEFRVVRALK